MAETAVDDATTSIEAVLTDADLLGLILGKCEDAIEDVAWCCPPLRRSRPSHNERRHISLYRALRLRRVSHVWCTTVDWQIESTRSFALRGCNVCALLPGDAAIIPQEQKSRVSYIARATELLVDSVSARQTPPVFDSCTSLTALSLRSTALSDAALASALASLSGARLRALSLSGSRSCGSMTVECLTALQPRALTALDLSACHNAVATSPMRFERLLQSCPRLARLNLSRMKMHAALPGAVCLALAPTLVYLGLDGCALDDSLLGLDVEDDGAPPPPSLNSASASSASASSGNATRRSLWARLTRLRELALADNPRVSARAVGTILAEVPALHSLDLGGADFWPSETEHLLGALLAAPSLRWLRARDCGMWLDGGTLRRLHGAKLKVEVDPEVWRAAGSVDERPTMAAHGLSGSSSSSSSSSGGGGIASRTVTAEPMDSWEEVEDSLPTALSLPAPPPSDVPAQSGTSKQRVPRVPIAYDRPEQYREPMTSIYHVSHGDMPYYGGGSVVSSQTGAHGLRS